MFVTHDEAVREALRIQTERQCSSGRHVAGCPHRPLSPWVRNAVANRLPASDQTGRIFTFNK